MYFVLAALALTLPAVSSPRVRGQSDGIIVDGADETTTLTVAGSANLNALIADVRPRLEVWYANSIHYYDITVPSGLPSLIEDRMIIWYANSNRTHTLAYPAGLTEDTTPPQISELTTTPVGTHSVRVSWRTDEFAASSLEYGTQSGAYTETVTDTLYRKLHEVTLTGLTTGRTYYFRLRNTDRSDNTGVSSEHSFTVHVPVYLPLVVKHY
jgi:hypothetical protein